jgi:tetratricopeptide (TPR) repeat protein
VNWPVRSGWVPPLADGHSTRPETGFGLVGSLPPGETVVLTPAGEPGENRLGGTGKTQLASALAHSLWGTGTVDLLVWVTAFSRAAVVTAYAQALADIGITEANEDCEADAAQFLRWLATTDRPWLVVFDDLADPADLTGLWPQGGAGRVVLTTQRQDDALRGPDRRIVPVGPFTLREALAYLTARLHDDPGQRTEALDLATDLGCHPLALAQATALMIDTRTSCRDYRRWLTDRRMRLTGALSGDPAPATEVTWSLSVERADQLLPAGLASPALVLAAMMDPSGIPGVVLVSHAACSYITGHNATPADQAQVRDAVNNLYRLGLLTVNPASPARTVLVHPVVQALVLEHLAPAEHDRAARAAADALLEAWPERDAEDPLMAQALRDSTAILNETAAEPLWTPHGHGVLIRAGQSLDDARLRGAATAYWRDMIVTSTRLLGPAHTQTFLVRDHLAAAQDTAGRLEEAIGLHERTLSDREHLLGPSHPETLSSYGNLAHAYQQAGRLDDSIAMFERTLADQEWVLGADHPDTLTARGNLARAYQQAGRLKEAISQYERTLADRGRALGAGHPDTLTARGSLAYAYLAAGRLKEAIPLFERTVADRERAQGPDHPDTLTARGNLAYAYRTAGRLKNAIPQYQRTLADRERVLGPEHPDTLTARGNLASAYHSARRVKDALPQFERTLADRERAQGPDHPDTLTARGNLASAYHSAGRLKDALPLYEQTLADCERVLGPDHLSTLTSRGNLAQAYHAALRLTDAVAVFQRTLADCEHALGPDHPMTRTIRENLAAVDQG